MTEIPLVNLRAQYEAYQEEIDEAISSVLKDCRFIGGSNVSSFESALADFLECEHVISCGNGTDALQLALMALELSPGDEVITTPYTFVATVEVIKFLGLQPVFVDIDPVTFNIDVSRIEEKITDRTKCIIPVHLFGQVCDMAGLMNIAEANDLRVIEDAAQAIGANISFDSEVAKAGTIGHIGTTSFFPSKNLSCYGDGGAVFTDDEELALRMREIANHGSSKKYFYNRVGMNSRLDSIQAAVLNVKLEHLTTENKRRKRIAEEYNETLADIDQITTPKMVYDHVWHQYTLRTRSREHRDLLQKGLYEVGVHTAIYYPKPLHVQGPYQSGETLKESERASEEVLSIPMNPFLKDEDVVYITHHIKKIFNMI